MLHAPVLQELDLKIQQPLRSTMGTMPRTKPVLHALILQELDLKIRPFWALLRHMQLPLHQAANINLAW